MGVPLLNVPISLLKDITLLNYVLLFKLSFTILRHMPKFIIWLLLFKSNFRIPKVISIIIFN